jgi:hypothetical protein
VVDADEETIGVVATGQRFAELRRIYLVARLGSWMDVSSAHQPINNIAIAEEQTAAFLRRGLARMADDLVPQLPGQDEPGTVDQRPPAIAGMTMTSLPSGTAAPVPPRVRASSSPM